MTERRPLIEFSDDELRNQLRFEMRNLGAWTYAAVAAEMGRRSNEAQAREANALAKDIRDLTSQIRWLTWAVVALGAIAAVAGVALLVLELFH